MWITKFTAARTLIWLAAFAAPVQGLPTVACACTKTATKDCCASREISSGRCPCTGADVCRCGESSPCHKSSRSRCSEQSAAPSCCHGCCCAKGSNGTCPCGANCQCGKNDSPEAPATPPTENNNSSERIVADATSAGSFTELYNPEETRRYLDLNTGAASLGALDRCVVLCRFML